MKKKKVVSEVRVGYGFVNERERWYWKVVIHISIEIVLQERIYTQ